MIKRVSRSFGRRDLEKFSKTKKRLRHCNRIPIKPTFSDWFEHKEEGDKIKEQTALRRISLELMNLLKGVKSFLLPTSLSAIN